MKEGHYRLSCRLRRTKIPDNHDVAYELKSINFVLILPRVVSEPPCELLQVISLKKVGVGLIDHDKEHYHGQLPRATVHISLSTGGLICFITCKTFSVVDRSGLQTGQLSTHTLQSHAVTGAECGLSC